jgi:hypothetical protein
MISTILEGIGREELQELRSYRIRERCCLQKNGTQEAGVRIRQLDNNPGTGGNVSAYGRVGVSAKALWRKVRSLQKEGTEQ